MQKRLDGAKPPQAILNLSKAAEDTQNYINKFSNKHIVLKIAFWQQAKEAFEEIDKVNLDPTLCLADGIFRI
jgi:hypothetical protein